MSTPPSLGNRPRLPAHRRPPMCDLSRARGRSCRRDTAAERPHRKPMVSSLSPSSASRASPKGERDGALQPALAKCSQQEGRHLPTTGRMFKISERYNVLEAVGKGSYGMVCSAVDSVRNNAPVAIKKITPMAAHSVDAKHVLREVRVMRHLGQHENIVTLEDLFCNEADDELYIVMELLDSDLNRIIQSQQVLSIKHHRVFMIQILQGVEFLHKNGVIHRDLKPGNILVSRNCEVRITDFGLARQLMSVQEKAERRQDGEGMTEHVVTRWYRPPELMLSPNGFYGLAVDLWSVGCVFGELLGRRPLFPGSSFVNQLSLIFDVLGAPAPEEVAHIRGAQARKFLDKLDGKAAVPFTEVLPGIPADAASLLKGLLLLDPVKRFTPRDALRHPFFDQLRERASLDVAPAAAGLEFEFEKKGFPRSRLKELIAQEIDHFQAGGANLTLHPKKRLHRQRPWPQQQQQQQQQQRVGPTVSGAAALSLKTAAAATAAAATACSSASFSSESESEHYGDDEEDEEEGDGRDDDSIAGREDQGLDADGGGGDGYAMPGDDDDDDDVARLDAASLQSSRLCPKEEEEDGTTTEGRCRSEPRGTRLLEVTASSTSNESGNDNDDDDGMTLSSSSPASSSSSSEGDCADDRVIFFERVATGYAHGHGSRRGAPCGDHRTTKTNPYREREADRLRATTLPLASGDAARIVVGRPLGGGGTHRSPPRVRSRTQDGTSDLLLIPAEESAQYLSPPSRSDRNDCNGNGSGVVVVASEKGEEGGRGCWEEEEEEEEPRVFPLFDSLAETSPTEPDGFVRSFLSPSPAGVVPPARPTRRGAVAGFVRGSDGWVGSDGGGTGGTGGGRNCNLFVGLQSPVLETAPGGELFLPPGVAGKSGGGGGVVGVGSIQSEEEEPTNGSGGGLTFRGMATFDSRSTVSESSSASDTIRRERAERAWRVVEEARERLRARADAVVAAAAAAKAPAVGAWRAERAAAVASESTRTAAATLTAPSFDHAEKWPVEFPGGGRKCSGSSHNAKGCMRRPPMSVATLEQATENTSWLLREGGGSSSSAAKPTSNGKSGAGVCGGKKQAPLTHHLPAPLVENGDPFCDFVSGKTSLVTHGDPFCDYFVSGKTTVSPTSTSGPAPAPVYPAAHPAAAPAPAAEAPPAPTGSGSGSGAGCKVPVMVVGQKLHVRGASAAYAKRGGPRLFFGGSGAKKSGGTGGTGSKKPGGGTHRSHHPPRAPVATVYGDQQPIKLRPAAPAKRFDLSVAGIETSSVTSSQGSPPPVPPPLKNRHSRGRKLSRVGSFNRSGSGRHRAPTRMTADGRVGVYPAAVVVVDSGFGRGRRRAAALPPPVAKAMRAKAKGGGSSRATKSGPVLARPPRGAATPVSAGERAGTRTPSHEKYYSINDVVTLKLPDRFCASSPGQNRDPALSQTRSRAGTRSSKPVDHSRVTISASGKPESIPPAEMLCQWADDDDDDDDDAASVTEEEEAGAGAAAAGAAAGEGGGGWGSGGPSYGGSSTTMVATTTSPGAAAAETAVTDDAVDDAGDSPLTSTTTDVAAVPEAEEETRALGPGWDTAPLASAVPEAPENETKGHDHVDSSPSYQAACPPPQQLNGHQQGAAQRAGLTRPPATEAVCNVIKEEEEEEVVVEGGEAKEGGGGGDNDEMMSASSAEQKFTLLRRLWKRSGAVRGSGKQRRGGISSRTRSYGGGGRDIAGSRVSWAGAGPPPKRPPQQQPRPRRAGSLKLFEDVGEDDDRGFGDETASLPTLMARAESLFPIPPRMDVKVSTSSQQQVRDTPLPGTGDKSHSRSISSQTTTTTGTSPASSATSGYRLDGPQALPLVHETVGRSGSPPTRRGSAVSSVGSGCTAASSLRPGGLLRRKDNIVRAVQFAPQEKELTPVSRDDGPREHRL